MHTNIIDQSYIDKRRAELKAQSRSHLAQMNACEGALLLLAEQEKFLTQPAKAKEKEKEKTE